jgi:antitoxin HigA-1
MLRTHPGEMLREDIFPTLQETPAEVARMLGISKRALFDVLEERQPVTPDLALRLAKFFDNSPEYWLNWQRAYDLEVARRRNKAALARIPTMRKYTTPFSDKPAAVSRGSKRPLPRERMGA